MKICISCGHENKDSSTFCGACGAKLVVSTTDEHNVSFDAVKNDNKELVAHNEVGSDPNGDSEPVVIDVTPSSQRQVSPIILVVVIALLFGCVFMTLKLIKDRNTNNIEAIETTVYVEQTTAIATAEVGRSSDDFSRMNYHIVVDYLTGIGFTNVSLMANGDIEYGANYELDCVSAVSIAGQTDFLSTDEYPLDSEIIVYYHSIADIEVESPDSYIGIDYVDLIDVLQNTGFTNINTIEYPDLSFGYLHSDGEVISVEINEQTDFVDGDVYPSGALIVITYHTFPREDLVPDSDVEMEVLSIEEYVAYLDDALLEVADNHTISLDEETVSITVWGEGPEECYSLAEMGDENQIGEWEEFITETQSLCAELFSNFEYVEAEDPHVELIVLGDTEESDTLLTCYDDGEIEYQIFATPTPTPTNTPTPTPTNTPTPTPTNTPTPTPIPTNTPTPTPVPVTRYAFQLPHPTYIQYYIIDTETHTIQYFTSYDTTPLIETYSGDITSEQVACYCGGEFIEYLQISPSGHSLILTEYDGYQYQFNYCSLTTAENVLNGDN